MNLETFARSLIGSTIGSDFQPTRLLGAGGMGIVMEAHQVSLNRPVALKVLRPGIELHDAEQRFVHEGQAMARVTHENVVTVYAAGRDGDLAFLAMEFLNGRPLNEIIRDGALGVDESLDIAIQVALGVEAAHQCGVVHRDLKPHNVFIREDGPRRQAKVLDFGIAKVLDSDDAPVTQSGHLLGTFAYMAPERIFNEPVSPILADVYALGVILYEMLSGQRPFQGGLARIVYDIAHTGTPPLSQTCEASLPPGLDDVVQRILHRDPHGRYQSMREVAMELEGLRRVSAEAAFAEPEPSTPRPEADVVRASAAKPSVDEGLLDEGLVTGSQTADAPQLRQPTRSNPRRFWAVVAVLVVLAVVVGALTGLHTSPDALEPEFLAEPIEVEATNEVESMRSEPRIVAESSIVDDAPRLDAPGSEGQSRVDAGVLVESNEGPARGTPSEEVAAQPAKPPTKKVARPRRPRTAAIVKVTIAAPPGSAVHVVGRKPSLIGRAPIFGFPLAAGRHLFRVERGGETVLERSVVLRGREQRLELFE